MDDQHSSIGSRCNLEFIMHVMHVFDQSLINFHASGVQEESKWDPPKLTKDEVGML